LDYVVSFSSDGSQVFFSRTCWAGRLLMPEREMFVTATQGPESGRVKRIGDVVAVSHDGKTLLCAKETSARLRELRLTNRENQTEQLIGHGWGRSFSADDKKIVFLVRNEDYRDDIMVWDISRAEAVRVPSPLGQVTAPSFCLKDTAIIFRMEDSERDGPGGIYIIRLEDNKVERLRIN
jgi:hypothetical protein